MLLELRFSVWTLGLTSGTFIAALYGMNLKNWIEEHDIGFWGVSGICFFVSSIVLVYGLKKLRMVQRVSMWGNTSTSSLKYLSPGKGGQALHEMISDERGTQWTQGGGLKAHLQNLQQQRATQHMADSNKKAVERLEKKRDKELEKLSQGPLWERERRKARESLPADVKVE
jgi:hypothetical protein